MFKLVSNERVIFLKISFKVYIHVLVCDMGLNGNNEAQTKR